ncbi:M20 family metallopeptidase [Agrobacterium rhizogenes]|uniref:Hippurate hydrolase protein n=2 Tax=Rhizobium rhizogenes TaxID=359 RepID=B9JK47_RHIR8|nr:M20 family metallopeptidase [Rhizobium rhizogenes]ACM30289.1 hippurate hydrolase protein [Rhizobium rhizogenes K84]OCJ01905.1 hippurate hydrolase [Agrobacterium sp. 13-626]OCJ10514.1 hippurate hydrolase [Agrobacterium sp. B131/95]OCJ15357.1 hippurate hydrolase [Agrobacterium sp. B133/95]KEA08980.1 hippurate hydrolase [Rhizobium rhizogenes]
MTLAISPDDIDQAALLSELRRWVEIETHTPDADAVNRLADRVEAIAKQAGLVAERTPGTMGFGDILAVRSPRPAGSNQKSVLILAHLDTVHAAGTIKNQLPWRQEGDRLYGPGIYDMKSGALMALEAMKIAVRHGPGPKLPVDLLFMPDEEMGSLSSRALIEAYSRNAGYALVVEPARDGGKIVVARKGVAMYDIVVRGRASHAGTRPQDGRSAVRAAARLVLELESLNDPARGVTVTVGTIHGGTGRNTVPAECQMQVDVRVPDEGTATEILGRIEALKPVDPDIALEISGGLNRPPFPQSEGGKRLFAHTAGIAAELGITLEGVSTGGGSDGNFTAALGVATLDGLGADGAGAHTFDEYIFVSSVAPRTALLANLMLTLDGKE